jgi:hypothetical protein
MVEGMAPDRVEEFATKYVVARAKNTASGTESCCREYQSRPASREIATNAPTARYVLTPPGRVRAVDITGHL